ncbi:MAG TPA: alpha-amylase family glycosyl hydrolase, partial [Hanamia sp.]|nr:alpha-amylase family glycosyl hydrolase [Hanamia sp.]
MSVAFPVVSWANGSNIYEVNIRQYTPEGTINAFVKHLPRLKDMGVEILWLMPVTPISIAQRQGSWGSYYAASSYVDVDPLYGTTNDFENFVAKAHEMGMKVIIDWVANHTGYDHQWTTKYPEFYHKDEGGNFTGLHGRIDV